MESKPITSLTTELTEKGIWTRQKIVQATINASGDFTIECGFAPKLVRACVVDGNSSSTGETDFNVTFSHINTWSGGSLTMSTSTHLVGMATLEGDISTRLFNGFIFNASTYSGSSKTVYFICYS